jgi:hypothetical protein
MRRVSCPALASVAASVAQHVGVDVRQSCSLADAEIDQCAHIARDKMSGSVRDQSKDGVGAHPPSDAAIPDGGCSDEINRVLAGKQQITFVNFEISCEGRWIPAIAWPPSRQTPVLS